MDVWPADLTSHLSFTKPFPQLDPLPGNATYLGLLGSMPIFVGMGKRTISLMVKLRVFCGRLCPAHPSQGHNVEVGDNFPHRLPARPTLLLLLACSPLPGTPPHPRWPGFSADCQTLPEATSPGKPCPLWQNSLVSFLGAPISLDFFIFWALEIMLRSRYLCQHLCVLDHKHLWVRGGS